jgi:putative spermidine/putrescine transport system substrate-binding protein
VGSSRKKLIGTAVLVGAALTISACSSSKSDTPSGGAAIAGASSASSAPAVSAADANSAADFGGMDALVAAAKKEGTLNVIALPPDWANYGAIISGFTAKYGIKVTSANPDGSSGDEVAAVKSLKSQSRAPDVVDVGGSYATSGAADGIYAPYEVATWADIPDGQKDPNGLWYNDYGGYISIGCDAKRITTCPTSIAALNNPMYKGKVALNGDPTSANAAFNAVYAAALANGGSLDNIQPGIDFFGKLKKAGIFSTVNAKPATIESGETPIVLDWDYLNAGYVTQFAAKGVDWKVADPTDALMAGFYDQAISKYAPHPAAARLWEEYLYSDEGQNLWLAGGARPARLAAMQKAGTATASLVAKLPAITGTPSFPTDAQTTTAKNAVTKGWASAVS